MMAHSLEEMIKTQIVSRGIKDKKVLKAMLQIDRADFVLEEDIPFAYSDTPLPLLKGQTISQPYIVALMTESLDLDSRSVVLEIGTGSGYQTAIIASIARRVYSIERLSPILDLACKNLSKHNFKNVNLILADGKNPPLNLKVDRIMVTAAAKNFPEGLFEKLKEGGKMVIPIEKGFIQVLYKIIKKGGKPEFYELCPVRFVPLV